jgi:hypothetical protein
MFTSSGLRGISFGNINTICGVCAVVPPPQPERDEHGRNDAHRAADNQRQQRQSQEPTQWQSPHSTGTVTAAAEGRS